MSEKLRHIGEALIPSIAYGDAAGLPAETMSAAKIRHVFGHIERLQKPDHNPFYKGDFEAGTWSDDTQLSMVVAQSLIDADGFGLRSMARGHVDAYYETSQIIRSDGRAITRGWGGATTRSVERIMDGMSPLDSGERDGAGNGVIMKIAPLVYWQTARKIQLAERYRQYDALTTMTHDSPVARLATRVHGDVLGHLMENGYEHDAFLTCLFHSIREHERVCHSHEVGNALWYLRQTNQFTTETILQETDGKGFYVSQTMAMAYGVFMQHPHDFERAVFAAVNLGGDTDSTASIVATMVCAATAGEYDNPVDFESIQDKTRLTRLSAKLAQAALS